MDGELNMISVRLDENMEEELNRLAKQTKRPKSFFIKEALREYLDDIKDVLDAKERAQDPNREFLTLDEFKKELNV